MAITRIAAVSATNASANADTTTGAIDTTGANLLVAWINFDHNATANVNDSKGNSWTPLTKITADATTDCQFYYSVPTSVGTSHTFTGHYLSGTGSPAIYVIALAGAATSPFDSNQAGASGATPGSVTPSQNNCIVISGCAYGNGPATAASGMTIDQAKVEAASSWGVAGAYLIQTTASAINPTFSGGSIVAHVSNSAVFRAQPDDVTLRSNPSKLIGNKLPPRAFAPKLAR